MKENGEGTNNTTKASIHEGEECLPQAIDLPKKANDLKENQWVQEGHETTVRSCQQHHH